MKDKTLYIIRGLPGTGKTTLANQLTPNVCEADKFFYQSGKYEYNPEKIGEAHAYCRERVKFFMAVEANKIAVSNTFSCRWEFAVYIKMAQENGYDITEITLTGDSYGSIHNVPDEVINRMRERWEK